MKQSLNSFTKKSTIKTQLANDTIEEKIGFKTSFMLSSTVHEIYPSRKNGILAFISMINTRSERFKACNFFICQYFSFYEQLKFRAQVNWAWKSFITSGPGMPHNKWYHLLRVWQETRPTNDTMEKVFKRTHCTNDSHQISHNAPCILVQ